MAGMNAVGSLEAHKAHPHQPNGTCSPTVPSSHINLKESGHIAVAVAVAGADADADADLQGCPDIFPAANVGRPRRWILNQTPSYALQVSF